MDSIKSSVLRLMWPALEFGFITFVHPGRMNQPQTRREPVVRCYSLWLKVWIEEVRTRSVWNVLLLHKGQVANYCQAPSASLIFIASISCFSQCPWRLLCQFYPMCICFLEAVLEATQKQERWKKKEKKNIGELYCLACRVCCSYRNNVTQYFSWNNWWKL